MSKIRTKLEKIENERDKFIGKFERLGWKNNYIGCTRTVLLTEIRDKNGNIVADHLWFNFTKGFENADLKEGDLVSFCARVKEYEKGYKGRRYDVYKAIEIDYKLSHPTKITKINNSI